MTELARRKFDNHCFSAEGVGLCKQVATKFVNLSHARWTANTTQLDRIGALNWCIIWGPTQFPIKGLSRTVSQAANRPKRESNRPEREADYSHSSAIDVTYEWSCAFTSTCLHDVHTGKLVLFLLSNLLKCLIYGSYTGTVSSSDNNSLNIYRITSLKETDSDVSLATLKQYLDIR